MLTVLVRYKKSRREVLIPARDVEYFPKGEPEPGLLINRTDSESTHLSHTPADDEDWRDVFVMNDHGATVARYVL